MLERGLISMDDDPHSPSPIPLPTPQKMILQNSPSTPISAQNLQGHHGYKNIQSSLPTTAVNQPQQQPNDLKSTLPKESLLKTSLLASPLFASPTSSSLTQSSSTTTSALTSMQFQESKIQNQQLLNTTELPMQQYKSILHTHLMSKQASSSSISSSGACKLATTPTSAATSSSTGTLNLTRISPSGSDSQQYSLQNMGQHQHSQQFALPMKQKQINQQQLMQEISQQRLHKPSTSTTMAATLLPHFVISTPSTNNSSNTSNSNNNVNKNNTNCISDVSNNLTINSLSSCNTSSNRNSNKNNSANSCPKSMISPYHIQTSISVNTTASTASVTTQTQTDDMAVADRQHVAMCENNGHIQTISSSGVSMGSGILNATTVNSVAGGSLTRRGPSHHHEAVTVVVFKTMLPDD